MIHDGIEYENGSTGWIATKNISNFGSRLCIPPEINKKIVVAIADHVFADNENLEEVIIPTSITEIGNFAFAGCTNLRSVKEVLGIFGRNQLGLRLNKGAFQGCKELKEILISSELLLCGEKIFQRCHKLETIGVTGENKLYGSVPNQCFQACLALEHLTIVKAIKCVISNNAFNWCSNLKILTLISDVVVCEDDDTWSSLKRTRIRCLPTCNLTELGYEGVEIEVIEDT